ncbi:MAG: sugar ABC transporter substrate-binding protein [Treponema sp.]|nr:sugar ABC transporter substrate-binding protein [Treponema sp.]
MKKNFLQKNIGLTINAIFTFVLLGLVFLGCTKKSNNIILKQNTQTEKTTQKRTKEKTKPRIGFSIATDTFIIERWNKDIKIFSSEITAMGGEVLFQLSAGGTDAQITQIEFLLSENIDALVVVPHDSDLLSGVIQQVVDKKIPVIAYDRLINGVPIDAYVSFDNKAVGMLMAKSLTQKCPHGNYLIINGSKKDNNSYEVNRGVMNVLEPFVSRGEIQIKKQIWLEEWSFDEAIKKAEEVFALSTDFDAITCGNDQIAEAVMQLLAERRLAGKILVTGQDADLSACQHIVEGTQFMTVYKPIKALAARAATVTMALINGKPEHPDEYVPNKSSKHIPFYCEQPYAVTKNNLAETVIKDGFHTEKDIYRNLIEN